MNSYQNRTKISLRGVDKDFDSKPVLRDINIDVREGELAAIVGPSGCGKSTIFNIIADLDRDYRGEVSVDGNISYMYQKDLLLPYKTIIDNVSLPMVIKGESKSAARKEVLPYFETFGLEGYENKYPRELSGGMKQRANFLRTFMCSKDIILLDEPFGALDSITKRSLQEWFLSVRKTINSTILLITHDIEEAIRLSDKIYVLSTNPASVKEVVDLSKDSFDKSSFEKVENLKENIIDLLI